MDGILDGIAVPRRSVDPGDTAGGCGVICAGVGCVSVPSQGGDFDGMFYSNGCNFPSVIECTGVKQCIFCWFGNQASSG